MITDLLKTSDQKSGGGLVQHNVMTAGKAFQPFWSDHGFITGCFHKQ